MIAISFLSYELYIYKSLTVTNFCIFFKENVADDDIRSPSAMVGLRNESSTGKSKVSNRKFC